MLQKFWDSAFALEHVEDEEDTHSDLSLTKSSADNVASDHLKYPTLGLGSSFAFKLEDSKGRVHRFNSGTESLTELVSAIARRVGNDVDVNKLSHIMYEDDEGDRVVLATDNDLVAAISHARSSGWKVLKLHLDSLQAPIQRTFPEEGGVVKSRDSNRDMHIEKEQTWGSSAYTAAVAGAAFVVGVSVLMFLKRSDT
ncbi:hypothetical protein L7F22_001463 [Adiantum nelumboides]|nr:hypothetical protein [Adiantum nelumboides]